MASRGDSPNHQKTSETGGMVIIGTTKITAVSYREDIRVTPLIKL